MELLDVVDENNNLIGIKEDKNIIHKKGLLHREIAVIIQNENGEYLVQKRSSKNKSRFARTFLYFFNLTIYI